MNDLKGQSFQIKIEKMAMGGAGVGRINGIACFVENSAPDDILNVRVTETKKNFLLATIESTVEPSPYRVKPPCPVALSCGGCSWQHITRSQQLKQKELILKENLIRIGQLKDPVINSILFTEHDFRYRNRVQIHSDGHSLGFFAKKSHRLVATDDCLLVEPAISHFWPTLQNQIQKEKTKGRFIVSLDEKKQVQVVSPTDSENPFYEFSQVNEFVNQLLLDHVVKEALDGSYEKIFDLFCGHGNFAAAINKMTTTPILGVELNCESIKRARSQFAKQQNLDFLLSDVETYLKYARPPEKKFLFILDPPRSGLTSNSIQYIMDWAPFKIIYISCHPVTLARDLLLLQRGYEICSIQPFDMFPQTDHLETVVILEHRNIDRSKDNDSL